MKNLSDSLSGQNMDRRVAGIGSSPKHSLSLKQKTKLWKKLRKLDCEYSRLKDLNSSGWNLWYNRPYQANQAKMSEIDDKRKEIRNKLKGYENH
jgi:hypothetical protein